MGKSNFESLMAKLEKIVTKFESGEESLENSLKLYEQGMEISRNCKEILDNAVQKVTIIENGQ